MESFEKKFPATSHAKNKNPCMARSKKNNNACVVQPKKKSYKSYSYIPACGLPNLSHSHRSYALSLNKARFSQKWESMQRDYMPTSITDVRCFSLVHGSMVYDGLKEKNSPDTGLKPYTPGEQGNPSHCFYV